MYKYISDYGIDGIVNLIDYAGEPFTHYIEVETKDIMNHPVFVYTEQDDKIPAYNVPLGERDLQLEAGKDKRDYIKLLTHTEVEEGELLQNRVGQKYKIYKREMKGYSDCIKIYQLYLSEYFE